MLTTIEGLTETELLTAPLDLFPPYGERRRQFTHMLKNLPPGGIGFHCTIASYRDSIDSNGLDPSKAFKHQEVCRNISYLFLDPGIDPLLQVNSDLLGVLATFARMKSSLESIAQTYSYQKSRTRYGNNTEPEDPLIVFIKGASKIATKTWLDHEIKTHRGPLTIAQGIEVDLQLRKPWRTGPCEAVVFSRGLIHGESPTVPRVNILGTYQGSQNDSPKHFAAKVILELLSKFSPIT